MKRWIFYVAAFTMLVLALPLQAQIRFGAKTGVNFSRISVENWSNSASAGWYVGPSLEVLIPGIGFGVESALLYSRMNNKIRFQGSLGDYYGPVDFDYLSMPINLKMQVSLPTVTPFMYAGPEFSVRVGNSFKETFQDLGQSFKFNRGDVRVNIGLGIEFWRIVQLSLSYNLGVTNSFKDINSKSNVWRLGFGLYF